MPNYILQIFLKAEPNITDHLNLIRFWNEAPKEETDFALKVIYAIKK